MLSYLFLISWSSIVVVLYFTSYLNFIIIIIRLVVAMVSSPVVPLAGCVPKRDTSLNQKGNFFVVNSEVRAVIMGP